MQKHIDAQSPLPHYKSQFSSSASCGESSAEASGSRTTNKVIRWTLTAVSRYSSKISCVATWKLFPEPVKIVEIKFEILWMQNFLPVQLICRATWVRCWQFWKNIPWKSSSDGRCSEMKFFCFKINFFCENWWKLPKFNGVRRWIEESWQISGNSKRHVRHNINHDELMNVDQIV